MLESYYNCGLTGWGSKYNDLFEEAIKATGLNESQLKVVLVLCGSIAENVNYILHHLHRIR